MLIGNVGNEPEIRYTDNNVCMAQLSLATSVQGYTLQNGTVVPERTEWHSIYVWGRLAQVVERYVHKGDKLYVEGELRYRSYTDKKGITRKVAEIWTSNLELLTPRPQTSPTQPVGTATTANGTTAQPANGGFQPSSATAQGAKAASFENKHELPF